MKGRRVIQEKGKRCWVHTFSLRFNGRGLVKFTTDPGKAASFPEPNHSLARALIHELGCSLPLSTWYMAKPPAVTP